MHGLSARAIGNTTWDSGFAASSCNMHTHQVAPTASSVGALTAPHAVSAVDEPTLHGIMGNHVAHSPHHCLPMPQEGCELDELASWRYQRPNLGVMITAALIAAHQLKSWSAAHPVAVVSVLLLSGVTAAFCARVFWGCRKVGIQFASAVGEGGFSDRVHGIWVYLLTYVTSLPGAILSLLTLLSTVAAWQTLATARGVNNPLIVVDPGMAYLHGILASTLVLLAVHTHTLLEYAVQVRRVALDGLVKLGMIQELEYAQLEQQWEQAAAKGLPPPPPPHVSPDRFTTLNLGLFVSLGLQAAWLLSGSGAGGLDVNVDDPLFAVLYWGVLAGGAYMLSVVQGLDWMNAWAGVLRVCSMIGGVIYAATAALFVDWEWITDLSAR